jgi:hypothetical protein
VDAVIITIKIPDLRIEQDFECLAHVPIRQILADLVQQYFGESADPSRFSVHATSAGVLADLGISLSEQGIWDGDILTLRPMDGARPRP